MTAAALAPSERFEPWRWVPIGTGNVLHLCPPNPGPRATSLCWRSIPDGATFQLSTFGMAGKCRRCLGEEEDR